VPCRHEVIQNSKAVIELYVLKGAGDAQLEPLDRVKPADVLALEKYITLLRVVESGDAVEEGGFSGSVGADKGYKFPVEDVHGHIVQDADPAKRQVQVLDGCDNGFFDGIRLSRHAGLSPIIWVIVMPLIIEAID